jgi:hypothetical protein
VVLKSADHLLTNLNNAQSLVNGGLCAEGENGIDLGGDLAGNDLKNLLAELDEEVVQGRVNLLGLGNGSVKQRSVLGLLGGGEDQGRVGGSILRLVLANGGEVTRVADDDLHKFQSSQQTSLGSRGVQWRV